MGKVILAVILFFIVGCAGTVEKPPSDMLAVKSLQNEPDGFRGIKWGQDVSEIKGLRLISSDNDLISKYSRDADQLSLGEAKLKYIHYYFWQDKLLEVQITATADQLQALKNVLNEKYGECFDTYGPSSELHDYSWHAPGVTVSMRRMVLNHNFEIWIKSKEVNRQLVRYRAQKANTAAKNGAQKDF